MKNKIIFLVVIGIILVTYLFIVTGVAKTSVFSFLYPKYVIIKDKVIFHQDNEKWEEINISNIKNSDVLDSKYTVYTSSDVKEQQELRYNNKWYTIIDNEPQDISNLRVATTKGTIKLADYNTTKTTTVLDSSIVARAIEKAGGIKDQNYEYEKITIDLNDSGTTTTMYFATNLTLSPDSTIKKSVIFTIENNEITIIDQADLYRFDLIEIADIDEDENYEFIVGKSKKETEKAYATCYQIYSFDKNKWEIEKECTV